MQSLSSTDESEDEYIDWTTELQTNRILITKNITYEKISPALLSALVFDREDDEIIRNHYVNPTAASRANAMVDLLLRKGKDNYEKFLNILGEYAPNIYTKITGRDPPAPSESSIREPSYSCQGGGDYEILSFCFARLQQTKQQCEKLKERNEAFRQEIRSKKTELIKLNETIKEYTRKQEGYDKLESDLSEQQRVTDEIRSENYTLCNRLLKMNEDKSKLKEKNMELRVANDKQKAELRTLTNKISSERSQSFRLRRQIDTGPSKREMDDLRNENEDLRMKIAQSHETEDFRSDSDTYIEILRNDLNAAAEVYETSSKKVTELREKLDEVESLKDKYLEENERLQLQCSALADDCEMYKQRRDAVWVQLQEVEAERDKLMKERNDAQLNAQTYLEEKTKYRYKLHQSEEVQDKLSHALREKEQLIKKLKAKNESPLASDATGGLDLIQDLPSDIEQVSTADSTSVVSSESTPVEYRNKGRVTARRRALDAEAQATRERSLTHVMRDDIFHTLVEADGKLHKVDLMGKTIQDCVEFTGGNETGIFIETVKKGSYAQVIGLVPGMKVVQIDMIAQRHNELPLRNCTLENVINIFQEIDDSFTIHVQYLKEEYERIQEKTKDGKRSGDSFYIRANFTLKKEGYLNFDKGSLLHVVNTRPDKSMNWQAYLVDPNTGEDINKSGLIPSYRNCLSNTTLLRPQPLLRPVSHSLDFTRLFRTMPGSMELYPSVSVEDIITGSKCTPYTVVKRAPVDKLEHRPCLFVPRNLSTVLGFKLTTMTEPLQFDLPQPIAVKCNEQEAYRRVSSGEAISCNTINQDMHEFVTVESVKKIIEKKKHCILSYNEDWTTVENFVMMLHQQDIYPIVFYLTGEKERALKVLLEPGQKEIASIVSDIKKLMLTLDKCIPQYATINLDRCSKLDDAVQQVMENVASESNKVLWVSGKTDVQI